MAKKKLKKLLKKALPLAALAAGAGMLARRNQMRDFLATEGGDRSNMTSRPNMRDIAGEVASAITKPRKKPIRMTSANVQAGLIDAPFANARVPGQSVMASPDLNTGAFDIGLKDGGKVTKRKKIKRIQIRGFGKARK